MSPKNIDEKAQFKIQINETDKPNNRKQILIENSRNMEEDLRASSRYVDIPSIVLEQGHETETGSPLHNHLSPKVSPHKVKNLV